VVAAAAVVDMVAWVVSWGTEVAVAEEVEAEKAAAAVEDGNLAVSGCKAEEEEEEEEKA